MILTLPTSLSFPLSHSVSTTFPYRPHHCKSPKYRVCGASLISDPDSFQVGPLIGSYGFINVTSYTGLRSGMDAEYLSDDMGRLKVQDVDEGSVKIRLYVGRITKGPLRGTPVVFKVYPGQRAGGAEADMMAANELNAHSFLQSSSKFLCHNLQTLLGGFETKTGEQWLAFRDDGKYSAADYAKVASEKFPNHHDEGEQKFWNPYEYEQFIKRRRYFVIKLLEGAMSGLAYMHDHDRLHQSLGPASVVLNTMVERDAAYLVPQLRDLAFSVDIRYSSLEEDPGTLSEGLWRRAAAAGAFSAMEKRAFGISDDIYEAGLLFSFLAFVPFCEAGIVDSLSLQRLLESTFQLDLEATREGMEIGGTSATQNRHGSRRVWTKQEEESLLDILDDVVARGLRCDTGSFKSGTMTIIERALALKCPNSGLKINPHIELKLKIWKKQYAIVYDMLNKSGFGWNEETKCVEVDSLDVWQSYVENNKQAEGWRGKPFPIYDRLLNIFGKDRATGIGAQTAEDMVNDRHLEDGNEDNEEIGIEDIPSPTSVNQTIHSSNQSGRKRKEKTQVDIVAGFSKVAEKMYKSFQMDANARMAKLTDILGIEDNDPKYLAVELKRLGFSTKDNLSISKSMRMDPSNVEVFKIIETDDEKIEFALAFKN